MKVTQVLRIHYDYIHLTTTGQHLALALLESLCFKQCLRPTLTGTPSNGQNTSFVSEFNAPKTACSSAWWRNLHIFASAFVGESLR